MTDMLFFLLIARVSAFIGVGRVEAKNRDGQLLMQAYEN
jgi:hypothetical protein